MAGLEATVSLWSQKTDPIKIRNVSELDQVLDKAQRSCSAESPTVIIILAHEHELSFPIGGVESFVQLTSASHSPPYFVVVGNREAEGHVVFRFNGRHHTEIPRRHIIPSQRAREIARQFLISGHRPFDIEWEEI